MSRDELREEITHVLRVNADRFVSDAADALLDGHVMSTRVVNTVGALLSKPRVTRKRRRCHGHLTDSHWIEVGDLAVWSALPPDNSEIGNQGWWHAVYCSECWPADTEAKS